MLSNTLCIRLILLSLAIWQLVPVNGMASPCSFEVLGEELQGTQKEITAAAKEIARNRKMSDNHDEVVLRSIENEIPRSNSRTLTEFLIQLIRNKSLSVEQLGDVRELTQSLPLSLPDIRTLYQEAKKASPSSKHAQLDALFDQPWGERNWRLENGQLKLGETVKEFYDSMSRGNLSIQEQLEQFFKLKPSTEEFTQLAVHLIEATDYKRKKRKAIMITSALAPTIVGLPAAGFFWEFEYKTSRLLDILQKSSEKLPLDASQVKAIHQSIIFHTGEKKYSTVLFEDWGANKINRLTLTTKEMKSDTPALPVPQRNPLMLEDLSLPMAPQAAVESSAGHSTETASRLDQLERRMQEQEKTVGEIRRTLSEVDWKSVSTHLGELSEVFEKLHKLTKSLPDE